MKIGDILGRRIELMLLMEKLDFDPGLVEGAAMEQPGLFVSAGTLRVQQMQVRARCEMLLDAKRSALDASIRQRATADGDKLTEAQIAAKIRRNSKFQALQQRLNTAVEEEEFSKILLEGYRMRRDSIRVIQQQNTDEVQLGGRLHDVAAGKRVVNKARAKLRERYKGKK